jgi:membrane protease YdiL (CAAX protease family)
VLPSNELVRQFSREMTELVTSPFGRVAIGLYPAVCEEFLYRGVILGLLRRGWRPGPAVVGQAVAFALAHVISVRLPWTFCFGLVLGWVRVRTGSLWACMAIHFLFNVAAGLGSIWVGEALPTELPGVLWLLPVGVGVLAVLGMGGRKSSRPARGPEGAPG